MATDVHKDSNKKEYSETLHIRELIKEICTLHKNDGYDKFEDISMFVREKNTRLNFQFKNQIDNVKRNFQLTPLEEKVLTDFANNKPKKARLNTKNLPKSTNHTHKQSTKSPIPS